MKRGLRPVASRAQCLSNAPFLVFAEGLRTCPREGTETASRFHTKARLGTSRMPRSMSEVGGSLKSRSWSRLLELQKVSVASNWEEKKRSGL